MDARAIDAVVHRVLEASHELPPDLLPVLVEQELERAGCTAVRLYLSDLSTTTLHPFPARGDEPLAIDGTLAGLAFRRERPISSESGEGARGAWIPMRDGVERVGVLRVEAPALDDAAIASCERVATVVALLVLSKKQFSDVIERNRRARPTSLAAELRLMMTPPSYFATPSASVACSTEPSYRIAGDAFDYGVDGDVLWFGVFDAMGHGLEAARMANLSVAAFRHTRRHSGWLVDAYALATEALAEEFGSGKFVTAQLGALDTRSGAVELVNAGHPPPFVLRHGSIVPLDPAPSFPLGIGLGDPEIAAFQLETGDRLVLYTDGLVEARDERNEPFGIARLRDVVTLAFSEAYSSGEAARQLMRAVMAHHGSAPDDDSTIMLVSWERRVD